LIIHTDSYNSMLVIKRIATCHPIACSIQRALIDRHAQDNITVLHWVPSHVGVRGNEFADRAAKWAAGLDEVHYFTSVSLTQVKANLKKAIKLEWEKTIAEVIPSTSWDWYRSVREVCPTPPLHLSRKARYVASRFRLGYRRWADIPKYTLCECGEDTFSMPHILVACPLTDRTPISHLGNGEELAGCSDREIAAQIVRQSACQDYEPLIEFQELNSHLT